MSTGQTGYPVGQLVMPRIDFADDESLDLARKLVEQYKVAGFIVFNGTTGEAREAVSELQSMTEYPLLFGCDAERGLGQILSDATLFPFLMSQGAADDPELLRKQALITADEMRYCGLNTVFAPVLDININPANPIINIRSFGDDPVKVARSGTEYISVMQDQGIICCGKHFPGHGDCDTDSHVSLPYVEKGEQELYRMELVPFREAFDNGLLTVMLAHVTYSAGNGDNTPATFSPIIIQKILRSWLGFNGLVFSDSFRMDALEAFGNEHETAEKSVKAGCSIILDPFDAASVIEHLQIRCDRDDDLRKTVNRQLELISRFRANHLLKSGNGHKIQDEFKKEVVMEICERSLCRIKGNVLVSGVVDIVTVDLAEYGETVSGAFTEELTSSGIKVNDNHYTGTDVRYLPQLGLTGKNAVIVLVYTSVRAWKKYSVIPEPIRLYIQKIINEASKESVLISFGSPYVTGIFNNLDIVLASFDVLPDCQTAAARGLLGKMEISGTLPVRI